MFNFKSSRCYVNLAILGAVGFVLLWQSNQVTAQQPWKAIKKVDRAIRNAQQAELRYSKRVYQQQQKFYRQSEKQQQKFYRQNEKAINRYYRDTVQSPVYVPVETAPVVYSNPVIVTPVVTSAPVTYSTTYSETIYHQPGFIDSAVSMPVIAPVIAPTPTNVVTDEWLPTQSPVALNSPIGQVVSDGIIYSEPMNSQVVYESAVSSSSPTVGSIAPVQSEPAYEVIESPVVPADHTESGQTVENEPTLAPIPDSNPSAADENQPSESEIETVD